MKKLLPDFDIRNEITVQNARGFNIILQRYIETSEKGNLFTLADYKPRCPICGSKDLSATKEEVLVTPNIEWLKISCELLNE